MENVPTIAQSGLPGYEMYGWYALMVPAGTPADVIEKLSGAASGALKSRTVLEKLPSLGLDLGHTTPVEAEAYIKAEITKWGKLVKEANIKVE